VLLNDLNPPERLERFTGSKSSPGPRDRRGLQWPLRQRDNGLVLFPVRSPFSCYANNTNVSSYTLAVGPQVSLRLGRFEPYAHALFGGALYRDPMSHTSFADILGGGINVSVISWVAWRVQADAVQTRLSLPFLPNKENSLRLSTGLVFRF